VKRVEWWGYFGQPTGYSSAADRYPVALTRQGFQVAVKPIAGRVSRDHDLFNLSKLELEDPVRVVHAVPTVAEADAYFTVFEFDTAPDDWIYPLARAEVVMTQSEFSMDCLSDVCVYDKIHVVPYPMAEEMTPDGPRHQLYGGVKEGFKFLSIFEWTTRKVPWILVRAFLEEFAGEDVALVLRAWSREAYIPYEINRIAKEVGVDASNVYWIPGVVDDVPSLYRGANAYVSPTAGEAWGATLSEAMACGIPTIGSNHGGNLEFMNEHNSWLVEVGDWEFVGERGQGNPLVKPGYMWKLPKVESVREKMREVYECFKDPDSPDIQARFKVERASKNVWSLCNEESVGEAIAKALEVFWQ